MVLAPCGVKGMGNVYIWYSVKGGEHYFFIDRWVFVW